MQYNIQKLFNDAEGIAIAASAVDGVDIIVSAVNTV
jgi:hypothetical protein